MVNSSDYGWTDEVQQFGIPADPKPLFPESIGEALHAILNPESVPGPPYTHTITAPPGWEYDDESEPVRPLFWPSLAVEARTPTAYLPTCQARPDSRGLHPLLLDHNVDQRLA